jgi:dynein heavy chain
LRDIVDRYMDSNQRIEHLCKAATEKTMIAVDSKRLYSLVDFQQQQEENIRLIRTRFTRVHAEIVRIMNSTHEVFKRDGQEVERYWARYCGEIDMKLQEALRLNVKKSLQDLTRAIAGDGKTVPGPVFGVSLSLEDSRLSFEPTFSHLAQMLQGLGMSITEAVRGLDRLPVLLSQSAEDAGPSYEEVIFNDRDIAKLQQQLRRAVDTNEPHIAAYEQTWHEKYHELWETDKDRFITRYAQMNPPLSKFDGDVARYSEVSNNVQKEETFAAINFVQLDCTMLKYKLLEHCNEWRAKLTDLLHRKAKQDLAQLQEYMRTQAQQLVIKPVSLDEVIDSVARLEAAQEEGAKLEAKFGPLQEVFEILEKYEIELEDETQEQLDALPLDYQRFQRALLEGEEILVDAKQTCKAELLQAVDELTRSVAQLRASFLEEGPFAAVISPPEALTLIREYHERTAAIRATEDGLKRGLKVFQIVQEPYKEMIDTEKELGQLEALWDLAQVWEDQYSQWQGTQFAKIATDQMEQQAIQHNKKLVQLARDVKDKDWDMVQAYRARVDHLRRAMPLIQDLKNPAMRERHWKELEGHVGQPLEPESPAFTLGAIIDLGLDRFTEEIGDISGAASKELSIEQSLGEIRRIWDEAELDISPYKDRGHFILKGTDEIFQLLEDNQVTLSTMKASRFVKAFESDVDHWERALSLILEIIEVLLSVQRQWMYLENIFLGEDIRKQLPVETNKFDDIDTRFIAISRSLHADNNAYRATHQPDLLKKLTEMNAVLEQIQKSLDEYLETKRQYFPRFYFVSNDDLLEMLGQSKNPEAIQPHLLKCFDNIKMLELHLPAGRKTMQAIGMHSSDAEYVPFKTAVPLEGPVETWLLAVEKEMRTSLHLLLAECIPAHRKHKRERWLREWAGQLVLTVSQMSWTTECVRAMSDKKIEPRKGLKSIKKKQVSLLNKLTEAVRAVRNKTQRMKLVALITIEVHSRDVLDRLMKVSNIDQNAFEWLMQLRFYWEKQANGDGECVIRQTNTRFTYGYEYIGNSGRLVITPLTDRCYMTLTTALHLKRGGSPKGPAGTGKTETVKDLGKSLGDYVIVINVRMRGGGVATFGLG